MMRVTSLIRLVWLFWSGCLLLPSNTCDAQNQDEQECLAPQVLEDCRASLQQHETRHAALLEEWRHKLNVAVEGVQQERTKDQTACQAAVEETHQAHAQAIRALVDEKAALQGELQTLQQQLRQQQEEAASVAAQSVEQVHREWKQKLEQEQAVLTSRFEQEQEELRTQQERHTQQAVQKVQDQHQQELARKKKFLQTVETERDQAKTKARSLEHKIKYHADELLAARQELLEANEIVRLYQAGFVHRWFVGPLTRTSVGLYDRILVPLGRDIYSVGHPVLDPLYEQVVQPILPYAIPAGELFVEHWTVAMKVVESYWKVAVQQVTQAWDTLWEQVPIYVSEFVTWATPWVIQGVTITYRFLVQTYEQITTTYHQQVEPHFQKLYQNVAPQISKFFSETQAVLLHHWTNFSIQVNDSFQTMAQTHQLPAPLLEFTAEMAKTPETTLWQVEWGVAYLMGLVVVRWLVGRLLFSKSSKTPTTAPTAGHKKTRGGKHHHHKNGTKGKGVKFAAHSQ